MGVEAVTATGAAVATPARRSTTRSPKAALTGASLSFKVCKSEMKIGFFKWQKIIIIIDKYTGINTTVTFVYIIVVIIKR